MAAKASRSCTKQIMVFSYPQNIWLIRDQLYVSNVRKPGPSKHFDFTLVATNENEIEGSGLNGFIASEVRENAGFSLKQNVER